MAVNRSQHNNGHGDGLSETIMVTLVVCENARPLMLPLQQTDICIATQKRNIMNGYNLLPLCSFTIRSTV